MAGTRGTLLLNAFYNTPIMSPSGRVLGSTGVLIPLTIFLDTMFGDKTPDEISYPYMGYSDYHSGYSDTYPSYDENLEYPTGEAEYSSYSQVRRNSWAPGMLHPSASAAYGSQKEIIIGNYRSLAEDQQVIYDQLAASLSAVGVDGRGCLLRFICEAQNTRINKLNLLGKMLATLLTPKEDHFLEEYNQAAALGRAGECTGNFDSCPISLFNIFKFARTSKTPAKHSKTNSKDSTKTFKDSTKTFKDSKTTS